MVLLETGKFTVVPSPATNRYPFQSLGGKVLINAFRSLFKSRNKSIFSLYLAIEKAPAVTGGISSKGKKVERLKSTES